MEKTQRQKEQDFEDMIQLPHHVSLTHPPMPLQDRAAQFSPFAALTGYEDIIREETRINRDSDGESGSGSPESDE